MSARFTLDGSDELERALGLLCQDISDRLRELVPARKLAAVVLGGGYGRGEGGVLRTAHGDRTYNDLEFYVFVRDFVPLAERRYGPKLTALGRLLSESAGLHVEFKITSLRHLRRSRVSMFSYDLLAGHRIVAGPDTFFRDCGHHSDPRAIPLSEATRLLVNRCTGLLLSKELLGLSTLSPDQADFIGRNLAKAQLGLGDALLTAFGQYHWSCRERHRRLIALLEQWTGADKETPNFKTQTDSALDTPHSALAPYIIHLLPLLPRLAAHHAGGVEFKLHPLRASPEEYAGLKQWHKEISSLASELWLWIESRRLQKLFSSKFDYSGQRAAKWPSPAWRNWLLNVRTFGLSTAPSILALRHPRERLLNSLPLLLWNGETTEPPGAPFLQSQLRTRAANWSGLLSAYKQLWQHYG